MTTRHTASPIAHLLGAPEDQGAAHMASQSLRCGAGLSSGPALRWQVLPVAPLADQQALVRSFGALTRLWLALALLCLAAGAWWQAGVPGVWWVAGSALLEELAFRGGLHEALLRRGARGQWPMGHINLAVATLFALVHVVAHPGVWALATVLPALLIGALYQRHRSVLACALLHALFNLVWLLGWPLAARAWG